MSAPYRRRHPVDPFQIGLLIIGALVLVAVVIGIMILSANYVESAGGG